MAKTEFVQIRLTLAEKASLESVAAMNGVTLSGLIRQRVMGQDTAPITVRGPIMESPAMDMCTDCAARLGLSFEQWARQTLINTALEFWEDTTKHFPPMRHINGYRPVDCPDGGAVWVKLDEEG